LPAAAGRAWCWPSIAASFLKAYPDIRLEVIVEDGFVDCAWPRAAMPGSATTNGSSRT